MPGWHVLTEPYRTAGDIEVVGIIQEQNPDRANLFMQWKQMNWPLLVDATNELRVKAVPYTLFIDEHGVVRAINPRPPQKSLEEFIATTYDAPAPAPSVDRELTVHQHGLQALETATSVAGLAKAATQFTQAALANPADGHHRFALGVAQRRLFEVTGDPTHFASAIRSWETALGCDPNQYIWRRRIQQYGPRLDKPYSFYDWVEQARADIIARGDTPRPLKIEPSGAELTRPSRSFTEAAHVTHPDPAGAIERDTTFIETSSIVVPHTSRGRASTRIHIHFIPRTAADAHWNNEAEPLHVWIDPPEGWRVDQQLITVPNAASATSDETRTIEFELVRGEEAATDVLPPLPIAAFYNVCEGENGTCLYRRLDLTVSLEEPGDS